MRVHPLLAGSAAALAFATIARPADALIIAQVTSRGYIMVDEPGAEAPYNGSSGASTSTTFSSFIAEATNVLEQAHAPHADFVAVLQLEPDHGVTAFYLPIRNDTRGVGLRGVQGSSETFDLNPWLGTAFPIHGAVFLNTPGFYIQPGFSDYGVNIVCPQEFGHRFLAQVRIPPYPLPVVSPTDGGAADADAAVFDADPDAVTADADPDAPSDGAPADATADAMDPPLAADSLLGRDRSHWSYFLNVGNSPVEGNAWEEIAPGTFRTVNTPIRFSALDLYLMGLLPPNEVPPFFVIAEPDVMNQLDANRQVINRASPPQKFSLGTYEPITIRGRRVDYTVNDVVRANGPRIPVYVPPDAGVGDAGTAADVRTMRVIWIYLTTTARLSRNAAVNFDRAVDACSGGYATAASNLARLEAVVMPAPPDAGTPDAGVSDATDVAFVPPRVRLGGGCGCSALGGSASDRPNGRLGGSGLAMLALVMVLRNRRVERSGRTWLG